MAIIASIHQPSTSTLLLFDNVLLLSQGRTVYFGPPSTSTQYFSELGHPPQPFVSPAESMLDLINMDFARKEHEEHRLEALVKAWEEGSRRQHIIDSIAQGENDNQICPFVEHPPKGYPRNLAMQTWIQLHRMGLVSSSYTILTVRNHIGISWRMAYVLPCTSVSQSWWERHGYVYLIHKRTFKIS